MPNSDFLHSNTDTFLYGLFKRDFEVDQALTYEGAKCSLKASKGGLNYVDTGAV